MSWYIFSIIFGFISVILLYLPLGLILIQRLSIRSRLLRIILGLYVGFSVVSSCYFFLGNILRGPVKFLDSGFLVISFTIIIRFLFSRYSKFTVKNIHKFLYDLKLKITPLRLFSILSAIPLFLSVGLSGFSFNGQRYIQSGLGHDSFWHIALINSLLKSIPPNHPSSYTEVLYRYHYFYDILFVPLIRLFHFDVFALYFQVFPFLLALLLGISASLLAESMIKKYQYLLPFFTFFGGSFAYLLPVFLPTLKWGESSFWVSQTFATMINPQAILTFGILYVVILVLRLGARGNNKQYILYTATSAFLIASSLGFKSYAFVILSIFFLTFILSVFFKKRKFGHLVSLFGIYLILIIPYLLIIVGMGGASSFIFAPFWFLTSMIESRDRVYYPVMKLREEHYLANGNILRVAEIKIKQLFIFFFGNLGTRAIILIPIFYWKKFRQNYSNPTVIAIFVAFIFSTTIPLLFIQRGIVWNSIQFWYYGLILANILVTLVLSKTLGTITSQKLRRFLILFLLVATLPTFLVTMYPKMNNFNSFPLVEEEWLKTNISSDQKIMICPSNDVFFDTSYISMFGSGGVLLADPVQLQLTSTSVSYIDEVLNSAFRTTQLYKIKKLVSEYHVTKILCSDTNSMALIDSISTGSLQKVGRFYVKNI